MKIPLLTVTLDLPLHPNDLRKLRGAIVEKAMQHQRQFNQAGLSTDLFHNHIETNTEESNESSGDGGHSDGRHSRYPLVQYKLYHRKAELVGVGPGAGALQLWLQLAGGKLTIDGKEHTLTILHLQVDYWRPILRQSEVVYRMNKWLPFRADTYQTWRQTPRLSERVLLLERSLWGNLHHLMETLQIETPREEIILYLQNIDMQTYKQCYDIKKIAFDVTFATNMHLPNELALGQGVSIGFGKLQRLPNRKRKTSRPKPLVAQAIEG